MFVAHAHAAAIHRAVAGETDFGPNQEIVFALPQEMPPAEMAARVAQSGYSRVPVYRESLDNVIGMVHGFDLLKNADLASKEDNLRRRVKASSFRPTLDSPRT